MTMVWIDLGLYMSLKVNSECYAWYVRYIYEWWMVWNGDQDIVSSGKEILVLRFLGCVLFVDLINKEVHMTATRCEKEPIGPDYID